MNFDHILGVIVGAFIGMLLLYIATKRRSARREETLSTQLDVERREAQNLLIKAAEEECEQEIRDLRRSKLKRAEADVADEARRILLAAMQRITSQPMNDATATIVNLPNDEMKGRIIGREGRNIRTFEHATGTTLMIDETPDSVLISCFNPVRREIARIALEALLRDGRIHPSSIEDEVVKAEDEMHANIIDLGEGALRKLRLHDVHPEVVALLGKLHYRLSNNQNTLAHSVEVANLCALIASEIGLDPTIAKRAGLFTISVKQLMKNMRIVTQSSVRKSLSNMAKMRAWSMLLPLTTKKYQQKVLMPDL